MSTPTDKSPVDAHDFEIRTEAYRVAREARNLEINLFWQRSNYFLVLSSATAAGFFSLKDGKYGVTLTLFGAVVASLWILINLGSKFWQSRSERGLQIAEDQFRPHLNLYSENWETVKNDVRHSFDFRRHGSVYQVYSRLVMLKPSVSFIMTLLSGAFLVFWVVVVVIAIRS